MSHICIPHPLAPSSTPEATCLRSPWHLEDKVHPSQHSAAQRSTAQPSASWCGLAMPGNGCDPTCASASVAANIQNYAEECRINWINIMMNAYESLSIPRKKIPHFQVSWRKWLAFLVSHKIPHNALAVPQHHPMLADAGGCWSTSRWGWKLAAWFVVSAERFSPSMLWKYPLVIKYRYGKCFAYG